MTISIRPITEAEHDAFMAAESATYSAAWSEAEARAFKPVFDFDRNLAVFDGDRIVGGCNYFPLDLSVPGAMLSAGIISHVFVSPSHRRRGLLRQMMARQLKDILDDGRPLAALHAAESSIYGRFGYGPASLTERIEIERLHARFKNDPEPGWSAAMLSEEEAAVRFRPVYEAALAQTPGLISRDSRWWRLRFRQRGRAEGSPDWLKVVLAKDDVDSAYAIYHVEHNWSGAVYHSRLNVVEWIAPDPQAYDALWRFLLGVDLVETVAAFSPHDPQLWWMLDDPRRLRRSVRDSLWVRLVDARAALEARTYATDGELTIAVTDATCPWNQGTYTLSVSDGRAECRPVTSPPDITASADALGAIYLGGNSLSNLAAAGLVEVHDEAALRRADAMFRWHVTPFSTAPEPIV